MSNFNDDGKRDPLYRNKHAGLPGHPGQTAPHEKGESAGLTLAGSREEHFAAAQVERAKARAEQLRNAGYVSADTLMNTGNVHDTSGRADWWDRAAATSEIANLAIPQMPEDNTPGMTGGAADSGKRRTHRMKYEGENFAMRMPSHTAMHRFADELAEKGLDATFDVPVEAVGAAGNSPLGWVRATRLPGGNWSTSALGFSGESAAAVAEAVNAVAEARRGEVRNALIRGGDLVKKAMERDARAGAELQEVTSSWISAAGYDAAASQFHVKVGDKTHTHSDISPTEAATLLSARSCGSVFHQIIGRGKFKKKPSAGLSSACPSCKRMRRPGFEDEHMCPRGVHHAPTARAAEMNAGMRQKAARVLADKDRAAAAARMSRPVNFTKPKD